MYYIIAEDTGQIVDAQDRRPTQAELEEMATEFETPVYVIVGEHAGLSAAPNLTHTALTRHTEDKYGEGAF